MYHRFRALLALVVIVAITAAGCGEKDEPPPTGGPDYQSVVDRLTQDAIVGKGLVIKQRFHVPGTSLTVSEADGSGSSVFAGTSRVGEASRPDGIQPIGSNSKTMTATAVMQLVDAGEVELDQTFAEIAAEHGGDDGALARLVREYPAKLRRVTLRQALNHTSGFVDCLDTPAFFNAMEADTRTEFTIAQLAAFGLREPFLFEPGSNGNWNYSNTDYMLAGMVLEAVTGESADDRMRAVLEEAGLESTYYMPGIAELSEPPLAERLISGYMPNQPKGTKVPGIIAAFDETPTVAPSFVPAAELNVSTNPTESGPNVKVSRRAGAGREETFPARDVTNAYSLTIAHTAGGVVSDSVDLARFWRELFTGDLVSDEALAEMKKTVPTGQNTRGVEVRWGLGFGEQIMEPGILYDGAPALNVYYHQGNIFGYSSVGYYIEGEDLAVGNVLNIFPQPIGDLGVLRDVLELRED